MNSLEDARTQLAGMGVKLSVKQIATIAYQFSQRARLRQTTSGMGISASLAGKRVGVAALPIAHFATQFRVLTSQFVDFLPQLLDKSCQRLQLFVN
jgi:hypothetical protein